MQWPHLSLVARLHSFPTAIRAAGSWLRCSTGLVYIVAGSILTGKLSVGVFAGFAVYCSFVVLHQPFILCFAFLPVPNYSV